MKQFLTYWGTHHVLTITFILAIVGLIVSLRKRENHKVRPLAFFFFAYVLMEIIRSTVISIKVDRLLRDQIRIHLDFADTIVEFFALFMTIRNYVVNIRIRRILKLFPFLFIVPVTVYFLYYEIFQKEIDQYFLQTIFTIEACLLIVACIFYYAEIFTKEPNLKLTDDPSFWVVTGVIFFMLCTLPFSILGMYLVKTNFNLYVRLFPIFEVFYWILFLMIIKAYFCKPVEVQ